MKLVDSKLVVVCLLGVAVIHSGVYSATFVAPGDTWRFLRGTAPPSEPNEAWKEADFNDLGWETGPSGFGYGDGDDETELLDMQNNYVTVYIRKEFGVSLGSLDPCSVVELVIDYDDGFAAYLNGKRVQFRNLEDDPPTYLTEAETNHEAGSPETFALGKAGELLNDGNNVLAVEGHNVSLGSSDFSLIPGLRVVSPIALTENTTWSGTVVLDDSVIVSAGVVLSIEPGTEVKMKSGVGITVYGQLLADGTESQPIRFTHYSAGATWERLMFIEAADSRLAHCVIEYSNCEGDHKDYYDDDCDPCTPFPSRTYFQAVVALACHLDIENCTFHKLPDDSASPEGDAIAIISDDPDMPGEASANIKGCDFISIGQGVHTRYSYVLVEDCYFTGHHGDNDDIDLYGESDPPPLVLNNVMVNPGHDDMINPTRCSAVMIGNIIGGCDDHGVVLRDKCYPVMMNNLIYNCSSAGIAVQNQCDALLLNNTIVNCGRGVRFFDHTGRWGPPYCLYPGSGKATLVNNIIWDCPTSLLLTDSPYTGDRGSHATVISCDIEGGLGGTSVSGNSTLTWDPTNIDADPLFANAGGGDFHLWSSSGRWQPATTTWIKDVADSPCIDAGTSYVVDDPNYMYSGVIDYRSELWPHGKKINIGGYGGTPEASMSSVTDGLRADLSNDGVVDYNDVAMMAEDWLATDVPVAGDINRDGVVNFFDYPELMEAWLQEE